LPIDYSNYGVRQGVSAFQHQSMGSEGKLHILILNTTCNSGHFIPENSTFSLCTTWMHEKY